MRGKSWQQGPPQKVGLRDASDAAKGFAPPPQAASPRKSSTPATAALLSPTEAKLKRAEAEAEAEARKRSEEEARHNAWAKEEVLALQRRHKQELEAATSEAARKALAAKQREEAKAAVAAAGRAMATLREEADAAEAKAAEEQAALRAAVQAAKEREEAERAAAARTKAEDDGRAAGVKEATAAFEEEQDRLAREAAALLERVGRRGEQRGGGQGEAMRVVMPHVLACLGWVLCPLFP